MKQYQVTRKLQVTIPKKLAEKTGIRPGDSVVFEEMDGSITLRKAGRIEVDQEELESVIDDLAKDMKKVGPRIREGRQELIEDLSRHVPVE